MDTPFYLLNNSICIIPYLSSVFIIMPSVSLCFEIRSIYWHSYSKGNVIPTILKIWIRGKGVMITTIGLRKLLNSWFVQFCRWLFCHDLTTKIIGIMQKNASVLVINWCVFHVNKIYFRLHKCVIGNKLHPVHSMH